MMEPQAVTVAQAKQITGLGITKLYELMNKGALESVKIGRRRLIKVASVERLLETA